MRLLPTLVTYKQAQKDAVDYKFQITNFDAKKSVYLDDSEESVRLPDWIPETDIGINLKFKINLSKLRESCLLEKSDELFLLTVISHQGTMRSETFSIEMSPDLSNQELVYELPINKSLFGQKFYIDLSLIVDPDLSVERNAMSATEAASVLWQTSGEVELERISALGDVRSENLDGAMWKFEFNVPNDSSTWHQLEWNSCVKIVIDKSRREAIFQSIELKSIMFSELLMFLFAKVIETPDGLENVLGSDKPSSFVSESRKHLYASFGGYNLSPESFRLKWKNESQNIFQDLQRNAFKVLKSRGNGV
jgi:hypothetical protein